MPQSVKISVIMPVYNVEKYLERCLSSICHQTYQNIEIICIDDGSTDKSLEILKQFQARDERIKIIAQQNQGASKARNKGLTEATGSYIYFMDSDD
ncbi:MAG: glycosyltransferase family 2 protein, partial [Alphaproteobacteria bacterium]|nr:glycosyltransferase family 2 protein [Alphaproteobacteria bacterium]